MPVYEMNTNESRVLDAPVDKIEVLTGGPIVVIENRTDQDPDSETYGAPIDPETTVVAAGDRFDAGGKAGLTLTDTGNGDRVYVEYTLSPQAPAPRDVLQVVVGADNQPERTGEDDETDQRGVHDVLGVPGGTGVQDVPPGGTVEDQKGVLADIDPEELQDHAPESLTEPGPGTQPDLRDNGLIEEPSRARAGDTDGDSETGGTGPYEDRTVPELKATAKSKGVDLEGATKKADIIAKLRKN